MGWVVNSHWLTVQFDLSDYKQLVIGQVKLDSFGGAIAKLNNKQGLLRTNQISAFFIYPINPLIGLDMALVWCQGTQQVTFAQSAGDRQQGCHG